MQGYLQYRGCEEYPDQDGLIPYQIYNMMCADWLTPQVIDTTTYGIELRDVRITGDAVQIPVAENPDEYFLLTNHQRTLYDNILNGRGVLIWHVVEKANNGCPSGPIIDLEHPLGEWEEDLVADYCPEWPRHPDAETGMDTLDCKSDMLPNAFYGGLGAGFSKEPQEFGPETNPSSDRYDANPGNRFSSQSVASGVAIRNFEAVIDSLGGGKYVIKFDVIFD
jgi:hypothetical protein